MQILYLFKPKKSLEVVFWHKKEGSLAEKREN